jgi:hypothetical protein
MTEQPEIADGLAGKVVALVGLGEMDTEWMVRVLEEARAFPFVLHPGDSVSVPMSGQLFDVVAIDASLEWDPAASKMPVLFVGAPKSVGRWTPEFHDAAHDFLITPCHPDEFLLRAYKLVSAQQH